MAMAATNAAYLGVERLIFGCIHEAMRKYGGNFDDYLSDAQESFVKACKRYTKERGKFTTFITFVMRNELKDRIRKQAKKDARLHRIDMEMGDLAAIAHSPPMLSWDHLSEDAQTVIGLVLDMPADIKLALHERGKYPETFEEEVKRGSTILACLNEFLEDLGWSMGRISDTFSEIQEAL